MVTGEEAESVIGKGNIQTFWDAGHVLFLHLGGADTEIHFPIIWAVCLLLKQFVHECMFYFTHIKWTTTKKEKKISYFFCAIPTTIGC